MGTNNSRKKGDRDVLKEDLEMFVIRDEHSMCVLVMSFETVIPYLEATNKCYFTKNTRLVSTIGKGYIILDLSRTLLLFCLVKVSKERGRKQLYSIGFLDHKINTIFVHFN